MHPNLHSNKHACQWQDKAAYLVEPTPADTGRPNRGGVASSGAGCLRCPAGVAGQLAGRGAGLGSRGSLSGYATIALRILSTRGTGVNIAPLLSTSAHASWLLHGEPPSKELLSWERHPATGAAL